ncbi:MAG: hypothetical protein M1318_01425 [Firmicutes bacterium]|jgi:hypothetical protein|nr:hypothetical protein [Bacillota bacterium]
MERATVTAAAGWLTAGVEDDPLAAAVPHPAARSTAAESSADLMMNERLMWTSLL